jgi:hypothetical protein
MFAMDAMLSPWLAHLKMPRPAAYGLSTESVDKQQHLKAKYRHLERSTMECPALCVKPGLQGLSHPKTTSVH